MLQAQPTLSNVFNLAIMLPLQEQKMLLDKVVANMYKEPDIFIQERRAHLAESERQIAAGLVYSEEESDLLMDQIVEKLLAEAV